MPKPRSRGGVGRGHEKARQKALLGQQPVAEQDVGDRRLRHQVRRQPPPGEHGHAVAAAHPADRRSVPYIRKPGRRPQFRVIAHAVAADELAALGREDPKARLADREQLAQPLEGRLRAGQHRR